MKIKSTFLAALMITLIMATFPFEAHAGWKTAVGKAWCWAISCEEDEKPDNDRSGPHPPRGSEDPWAIFTEPMKLKKPIHCDPSNCDPVEIIIPAAKLKIPVPCDQTNCDPMQIEIPAGVLRIPVACDGTNCDPVGSLTWTPMT